MTHEPGAEISGFGTPVTSGPALENQQTPPGTTGIPPSPGRPPAGSSTGVPSAHSEPSIETHPPRFTVQPTAMRPGCVAGRLMVPSRTPYPKPRVDPSAWVTAEETQRSAVPCPCSVIE